MTKQRELAVKVMKFANETTHWDFQMEQVGESYLITTAFRNQRGQKMAVCYQIGEDMAELQVISMNSRYDYESLQKRVNGLGLSCPVYGVVAGDKNLAIVSPIPSELLDRYVAVIVRKRMVDMLDAMADIIGFHKR